MRLAIAWPRDRGKQRTRALVLLGSAAAAATLVLGVRWPALDNSRGGEAAASPPGGNWHDPPRSPGPAQPLGEVDARRHDGEARPGAALDVRRTASAPRARGAFDFEALVRESVRFRLAPHELQEEIAASAVRAASAHLALFDRVVPDTSDAARYALARECADWMVDCNSELVRVKHELLEAVAPLESGAQMRALIQSARHYDEGRGREARARFADQWLSADDSARWEAEIARLYADIPPPRVEGGPARSR